MIIDGDEKIILQLPLHSKDFHLVRCYYFFLLFYTLFASLWVQLLNGGRSAIILQGIEAAILCCIPVRWGVIKASNKLHSIIVGEEIFPRQRSDEGRCVCANLRDKLEQFWPEAIFVHELFYPWPNQKTKGEDCTMSALVEADMVLSAMNDLEFRQKYSAARHIFKSLLGVWISRWNAVSPVWYIMLNLFWMFFALISVCEFCCTEKFRAKKHYVKMLSILNNWL